MTEAQHALELDFQTKPDELKQVSLVKTPEDALVGASALIIVTEWKAFRSPDFDRLKQAMQNPIIFDGRNLYEPQSMTELGFEYYGIGRHN
jgi:UDPglucose 6-dehydrogenase